MSTMSTILVWLGNGFAFTVGASIGGFLVGLLLRAKPDEAKKATALLEERNRIGERQAGALEDIAERLDSIASRTH
jgi:hypothetical protein